MVKDIRRLIFNYTELSQAVRAYAEEKGLEIPAGKVVKLTISGRDAQAAHQISDKYSSFLKNHDAVREKQSAILTFFDDNASEMQNQYYPTNTDLVCDALVSYCINHPGIVIPRHGLKSITKTEFDICLDVYVEIDGDNNEDGGDSNILQLED